MAVSKKSPDAFRTIGEVATWLETPAHVLRFWESRFPEIAPVKGAGGRRYYRPEDMRLLGGIKQLLHEDGRTIKAVQEQLAAEGASAVAAHSPDLPTGAAAAAPETTEPAVAPEPAANDAGRPPIGYFFDDSTEAPDPSPPAARADKPAAQQAVADARPTNDPKTADKPEIGPIDTVPADPDDGTDALRRTGPTVAANLRGLDPECQAQADQRTDLTALVARLRTLRDGLG